MPNPLPQMSRAVVGSHQAVRPIPDRNLKSQLRLVEAPQPVPRQIGSEGFGVIDNEKYNQLVVELLRLPGRAQPQDTLRVFVTLVGQIKAETAQISMTRDDFAKHCGIAPRNVSTAMTNLEKLGLIRREYSGGTVTYFVRVEMLAQAPPELPGLEVPSPSSKEGDFAS
jgi:hypothetical protein